MPASQFPVLQIWGCFDDCEQDWTDKNNESLEILWTELANRCVCADTAAGTITNTTGAITNPTPGTAIVDATGCLCVYTGPNKGWLCNPPVCGRQVFDKDTLTGYIWDGTQWKISSVCETVQSQTVAQKEPSTYPTGTNAYNTTATPWVEFQTINGVWIETGRTFDPATCKITQCLVTAEIKDKLVFKEGTPSAADPLKPEPSGAVDADEICLSMLGGKLFKELPDGTLSYVVCQEDLPFPCAIDDAAAEALWLTKCFPKQDGLYYFNSVTQSIKVCKDGLWIEIKGEDNCCPIDGAAGAVGAVGDLVYWDTTTSAWALADGSAQTPNDGSTTASHMIVEIDTAQDLWKIQSTGPVEGLSGLTPGCYYWLDPATPGGYTDVRPTGLNEIEQNAFVAITATKAELLLNIPPCIVSDSTINSINECFIAYQTQPQGTVSGTLPAGVWTTRVFNTVQAGASFASLAAGQITLLGGCCYTIKTEVEHWRADHSVVRLFDVTNGTVIQQGPTTYSSVVSGTSDQSTGYVCAEYCVSADTVIEVQHISSSNGGSTFGQGRPGLAGLGLSEQSYGKIEIAKKRSF